MNRTKLAVPWILFGITVIVCIALAVVIVIRDKEAGEQPIGQNAGENSNPNFQDYSDYDDISRGYYVRADSGSSFIVLGENGEGGLVMLHTEDETMFSELMNGDVIIAATDKDMDASFPGVTGVYQCVRIEINRGDREFLSEAQEELEELAELGYTFEDNWRR